MRCGASGGTSSATSPLIRPRDENLRFGEQQRAQAVALRLQAGDLDPQPHLAAGRAHAGAHQKDRRHHGKPEQRQRGGQNSEFLMVEVEPGRNGVRDGEFAGGGGSERQQKSGGESAQAVARQ